MIKNKMKETGARIAGEMSGHMFFSDDYYGFDDALYAACRLVDVVARSGGPLSLSLQGIPRFESTPEIRIDCPDDRKFDVVARAIQHFSGRYDVLNVDGARLQLPDSWALIRASNTQPVIVARIEADSDQRLLEIGAEIGAYLGEQGVVLPPLGPS